MSNFQGGQRQRTVMSQGMVRPGVRQEQYWRWRTCWEQAPLDRLPFIRPTPARRADPRLSNPVTR